MSIVNRVVDKVYVINMDSQKDRMEHMDSVLKHHGITYTRFSAVKGSDVKFSDRLTSYCNKFCPDGMKGCALSHNTLWKDIIEKNYSYALILEDDVQLDPVFFESVKRGLDSVPSDFDILWLGCHTAVEDDTPFAKVLTAALSRTSEPINEYVTKSSCGFGAYGYIISKPCAERFIDLQIPFHIDYSMAKWIETYGLKSYVLRELPVKPNDETHATSTLSETFPKGVNTVLKQIPASNHTSMDWTLGESFLKLGGFTFNGLTTIVFLIALLVPQKGVVVLLAWLLVEFILSFDVKNTVKFGLVIGAGAGIRYSTLSLLKINRSGRNGW